MDRVIEEYDLSAMNERLAERRRGTHGDVTSFRDLTAYLNRGILRRAMERNGINPIDGEVENAYRILTDDEVSRGERIRLRKRLERNGVDMNAVEESFVSHPTVGNHLKNCLDIQLESDGRDPVDRANERIFKLQNRSEAVMKETLERLVGPDHPSVDSLSVFVDARVMCESCGTQSEIRHFIENGGCECVVGDE